MIAVAVAVALVVLTLVGAVVVLSVDRRRSTREVDRLTVSVLGETRAPSHTFDQALGRLERATAGQHVVALQHYELERYRAALGSITLGVVLVDESGDVVFHNEFASWFLEGRHGEAVVGQAIDELVERAVAGESGDRAVQVYGPPRRKLYVSATPIDEEGTELGAVVLINDVTEEERLDAIRRDFVANISHELRTPIGAMSLLAQTLAGEDDPEVVDSLAGRLSMESERLASTVDDLLELSRIEHGSDADFQPVVLQGVVNGAHDRVRSAAKHRDVSIGIALPERDLVVRGDRRQLTSAVFNLLDNGVKYMGAGGGTVSVRGRLVDDEIELVVQDSGIGVPRKDLDRIFERFYRVDRGRSRASGGTGLGLSIVRHIVANHGGRVTVDSSEGEGSTFTMVFPALQAAVDPGADVPDEGNDDHEVTAP